MPKIQMIKPDALTKALAERLQELWDAYVCSDAASHSALLADDYRAVHRDGSVHVGKPSAQDMAAAPIEDYWIKALQA